MLTRLLRASTLAIALVAVASVPASAAPILTIQVLPAPVVGGRGDTVDVFVVISNAPQIDGSVGVEEFIGVNVNGDPAVGTFDGSSSDLYLIAPQALAAGATTGQVLLGTFTFAANAVIGSYASFAVDIDYLFGDSAEFDTASADFRAQVVPEPATLALLGFGLAAAGVVRRRRA